LPDEALVSWKTTDVPLLLAANLIRLGVPCVFSNASFNFLSIPFFRFICRSYAEKQFLHMYPTGKSSEVGRLEHSFKLVLQHLEQLPPMQFFWLGLQSIT
jgi:hypothetical protein